MSRQKSKSHDRRALAPASREEFATKALDAERFREAIEAYKDLLKTERRAPWVEALAAAYAGRAAELQAKGMIPEALTIWRNRATACGKPLNDPAYIDCLCLGGASSEAFRLITAIDDPTQRAAIETRLAAIALLLPADALTALPADSPLRRHHGNAVAALRACSAGDSGALDSALREIPFRSPYRDLRPVLKALNIVQRNPAQANELLARIDSDSPFGRLAAVTRIATLPDDEWLPALAEVDSAGREILLDLKGCPQAQRPHLLELARLGPAPAAEKVLAIFLRSGNKLAPGTDALCRRLLPHALVRTREISEFLKHLPPFEAARIAALSAEMSQRGDAPCECWLEAVAALGNSGEEAQNAAIILQRLALGANANAFEEELCAQEIKWLEKSLELDADNPGARLRLIRACCAMGNLKLARQHLDLALANAPNDAETLLVAVETALAAESHKKALGFAKRLLELDPINPRVRGLIAQAYLAQARKQIRAKRPELALKELDQALPWLANDESRRVAEVLRALCANDAAANVLLRNAVAGFAGPLCAGFCLAMEAYRIKLEPHALFGRAELKLNAQPSAVDLAEFVRVLNAAADKEHKTIAKSLASLRNLIELAAANPLAQDERIAACEALLRRNEFQALKVHARAALKDSPNRPILIYFASVAALENKPWKMLDRDIDKLEMAQEKASQEGDLRTARRIEEFFEREADRDAGDDPFGDEPWGMDESNAHAMVRAMIVMNGTKNFLDMIRRDLGAARFNALKATAGNDEQRLLDLVIDYLLDNGLGNELFRGGFGAMPMPLPAASPFGQPKTSPKIQLVDVSDRRQKGLFDD